MEIEDKIERCKLMVGERSIDALYFLDKYMSNKDTEKNKIRRGPKIERRRSPLLGFVDGELKLIGHNLHVTIGNKYCCNPSTAELWEMLAPTLPKRHYSKEILGFVDGKLQSIGTKQLAITYFD